MSLKTAEFCSPSHPDKTCDFIADSILDAYLAGDKDSRVAVEVMGGHGLITINGEVTSKAHPDLESIVKNIVGKENKNYKVIINLSRQSEGIAQGVDVGGAGDQGIMKGYATAATSNLMPLEYNLARDLCAKVYQNYPYDGKVQVTIEVESEKYKVKSVVVSFQNSKNADLLPLVKKIMADLTADSAFVAETTSAKGAALAEEVEYLINPAGEWTQGGFDADTGLSGRKLVIDNYGPEIPIGGGSFSGKDYTKVDRSGAYMARKIAVDFVRD